MQQFLKPAHGSAWAEVVATKFHEELLIAVDDSETLFDLRLGRVAHATLTGRLEKRRARPYSSCVPYVLLGWVRRQTVHDDEG